MPITDPARRTPSRCRLSTLAAALAAVVLAAGCGGGSEDEELGTPEPAEAPELTEEPAGTVIEIGNGAEGIVIDGETGLAAVGLEFPPSLELIDVRTLRTERLVGLPAHPRHLQLAAPGGPVLVPSEDSDELIEVSLPNGRKRATGVGDFPHDATAAPDGRIFVGDEMSDTISVIEDGETVDTLDAPVQPGNIVYADGRIATVAVTERVITTYDPRTLEQVGQIPAGVGPTHAAAVRDRVFVADTQGDQIIEYDLAPELREVGATPLEGTPYGITADDERDRLWVTLTAENTAVEYALEPDGLREVERYSTVRQANTIAVDPRDGVAYVVSRDDPALLQRLEGLRGPVPD